MTNTYDLNKEKAGIITTTASLFASIVAGLACIGPMLGIAFGITGLGWLTQYSYLTLPASIVSISLLLAATYLLTKVRINCVSKRRSRFNSVFLVVTAFVVVGINVFEYLVIPNLNY